MKTNHDHIRSEIFSAERLIEHAKSLAVAQKTTNNPQKGYNLYKRLKNNKKSLFASYQSINESVNQKQAITSAGEWLIDNFHIVEEQLKDIQEHLPIWFYKELPKLAEGPLQAYPRVYGISWAFVAHADSRFDPELLIQFVRGYQSVQILSIGELWAIAITLRVVLIENLRLLSANIVNSLESRLNADTIIDDLLGLDTEQSQAAEKLLLAIEDEKLSQSFLVQLIQRLRYQDPSTTPALKWLNKKLSNLNLNADEIVSKEHNEQSANNLTVRNIITSMRLISAFEWRRFFEAVSLVNETLNVNPIFAAIDSSTQDQYLHALEELAKGSNYTEIDLAKEIICRINRYQDDAFSKNAAAHENASNAIEERKSDPAYYLISRGRKALEKDIKFRPNLNRRLKDFYTNHARLGYATSILASSSLILAFPLMAGHQSGLPAWLLAIFALIAFPLASDIALPVLNKSIVLVMGPQHLPRIKLEESIPEELSTFVVMPILLINQKIIEEHLQQLEVHYLSNPETNLYFALLADWKDSDNASDPDDMELLNLANQGIEELNSRYGEKRFYVFARKRLWSTSERKWMGWERKRGKLHEFNRLLRGATDTSYIDGPCTWHFQERSNPSDFPHIKYIITLDADTRIAMGTVRKLVGTMAHPLNKPRIDKASKRVVEGYGILQPRVMASLPSRTNSSIFQKLFSGLCGIDPYSFATSDIYQDLFGEGTYIGKGIYDIDAFESSLQDRIPVNSLLSHDLFEGTFARCAFISDVDLFEDYPSHVEVAASRADRWTRGDWQLLAWIFGRSTPLIGRWKMLDNLRRSSSAPMMIATLMLAWFVPQAPHVYWTSFVLVALCFPLFLPFISSLIVYPRSKNFNQANINLDYEFIIGFQQSLCQLSLLLHYAVRNLTAIIRTLYRLFISKHKLLEWVSVAQQKMTVKLSLSYFFAQHSAAILIAIALACALAINKADNTVIILASPFIILWTCSAVIARYISLPPKADLVEVLDAQEQDSMRLIARRTWRYFTDFVKLENNWLPPDNFQESPVAVVAQRSSPTNFGLYLLSIIAAKDFSWLGLENTINKLELSIGVLEELPRYKGHFYNWYNLTTKEPLNPRYISSVDSGNCAAYLMVCAQASREFSSATLSTLSKTRGIVDSLSLMKESLLQINDKKHMLIVNLEQVQDSIKVLESLLEIDIQTPSDCFAKWQSIRNAGLTLVDITRTFVQERGSTRFNDLLFWAEETYANIESQTKDIKQLLNWVKFFNQEKPNNLSQASLQHLKLLNSHKALDLGLSDLCARYQVIIAALKRSLLVEPSKYLIDLLSALEESSTTCDNLSHRASELAKSIDKLAAAMDFNFLYDPVRKLFSIGFSLDNNSLDPSYYDMLASEARLTSFISIAKGEVAAPHWFSLSRVLTPLNNGSALLSWSGSMFEYLMPSLVMYTPRESLLDRTCRLIIKKQIAYGAKQNVPWGISESAYNIRDLNLTYQYSSFGVPGLGLKRGIAQDLVISPYSCALAAMYYPKSALENFKKLTAMKALGTYGFYEAIDFTATRVPENKEFAIVQTYMAHHQGMSIVALANVIFRGKMRHRFHNIPTIRATELLLQERTPHAVAIEVPHINQNEKASIQDLVQPDLRYFTLPNQNIPATHLLSNGHYSVMLSSAGSGYSTCNDIAVTRWREDPSTDAYGTYIFLYDTSSKRSWSAAFQPSATRPDDYHVIFAEDKARIIREDDGITSTLDVLVSAEDNAEIRRISIKNTSLFIKEIELTSYAEVVLSSQAADSMHPAFSNLFVETEYLAKSSTLIASRRPRSSEEQPLWLAHTIALEGSTGIEYETDRSRFLGRGHSIRDAVSILDGQPLSNTVGAVLDPIVSLRTRISIPPGATKNILFSTMISSSREGILDLADKYHDPSVFERACSLTWTYAQAQLHHLGINDTEANLYQQLASSIIYSNPGARPLSSVLQRNEQNLSSLWRHRISGDNPIVLVHIDNIDELGLVRQLLRAYEYLRLKRLEFDLIILNGKTNSYVQDLQIMLETMVRTSLQTNVFVLRADLLNKTDIKLFETAARLILSSKEGSLSEQVMRIKSFTTKLIYQNQSPSQRSRSTFTQSKTSLAMPDLEFFNGLGGFSDEGYEYVTVLTKLQHSPAPWINIIANDKIGFIVSESGSSYSWSINSRENQISPWSNDPVIDPSGEVFYIQDEETKEFWTPTALPIRIENTTYIARHGQGYSSFEHLSHDIETKLTQFVSYDEPVKISRLNFKNHSNKTRRLVVTAYIELVLGSSRSASAPYIISETDQETKAMFAHNPWNIDFGRRISFIDFAGKQKSWTADRTEFIGRNGNLKEPAAIVEAKALSNKTGAGFDPCLAQQLVIEIPANANLELGFILGQTDNKDQARELIKKYRSLDLSSVLENVKAKWDETLSKVQIKTPDRQTNFILNRWSLYQTLVCRYWARTAFYQAGGAFGFRDQLQDVMALTLSHPEITRAQILNAASHQFVEGDVQHWWHPPSNKGVRTHCSDDSLWLPYVVSHYIKTTGDYQILSEEISFLEGRAITNEEESAYFEPTQSPLKASLYEHCKRILDRSLKVGIHGLPLIGSGDWNDGMNKVGSKGLGESVWLGWFLYATLTDFAKLSNLYQTEFTQSSSLKDAPSVPNTQAHRSELEWLDHAAKLQEALEREAWDGAWYRRAYFDDGTILGSASNLECRIDSIAQSWSVISQAADKERSIKAMDSVEKYLVNPAEDLILLFTPPFDKGNLEPGYIKGYLPGIRENGSQYTHAACWTVMAFALLGNGNKTYELFSMLNPINHTSTRAGIHKYKVEPYVMAADIYSQAPHLGRGGWTWYTGSAALIYRTGIELILGLSVTNEGKSQSYLWINPCIPDHWTGFKASYRHGSTIYKIKVINSSGANKTITLDGQIIAAGLPLIDDAIEHLVLVTLP